VYALGFSKISIPCTDKDQMPRTGYVHEGQPLTLAVANPCTPWQFYCLSEQSIKA